MNFSPIRAHKLRLDNDFRKAGSSATEESIGPMLAKYLCIAVTGYFEQSVAYLLREFSSQYSRRQVGMFAGSRLEKPTNLKREKFLTLIGTFDAKWRKDVEKLDTPLELLDSIYATRNDIAHGRNTGITLGTLKRYYSEIQHLIDELELCVLT